MASHGLQLENVTAGYRKGAAVVHGMSGVWAAGKVTALLGPNGAGKSTLLRAVLGVLPWATGGVALDGESVDGKSHAWRAQRIGYVPQQGGVRFGFTVRQVVAMGRYAAGLRGDTDAVVSQALEQCDAARLSDQVFAELSGGQQRRVLLARAAAQAHGSGRVVLADEPTAGLDLEHIDGALRTLRGLAEAGLVVVVVLHDVNLAARWADAVWLMDGGALAARGPAGDVLTPEVLGPVYRVRLRRVPDPEAGGAVLVSDGPLRGSGIASGVDAAARLS